MSDIDISNALLEDLRWRYLNAGLATTLLLRPEIAHNGPSVPENS
jgi:hypothetical protein